MWLELNTYSPSNNSVPIMVNFNKVTDFYTKTFKDINTIGTRIDFNDEEYLDVVEDYKNIKRWMFLETKTEI